MYRVFTNKFTFPDPFSTVKFMDWTSRSAFVSPLAVLFSFLMHNHLFLYTRDKKYAGPNNQHSTFIGLMDFWLRARNVWRFWKLNTGILKPVEDPPPFWHFSSTNFKRAEYNVLGCKELPFYSLPECTIKCSTFASFHDKYFDKGVLLNASLVEDLQGWHVSPLDMHAEIYNYSCLVHCHVLLHDDGIGYEMTLCTLVMNLIIVSDVCLPCSFY